MRPIRPPMWFGLAVGAVAIQTLALFVARRAVIVIGNVGPCASALGPCAVAEITVTYPFAWLGVAIYLVGAACMGVALFLLHRVPRRPLPPAVTE